MRFLDHVYHANNQPNHCRNRIRNVILNLMKQKAALALALFVPVDHSGLLAQEKGTWRAASKTARAITGDIALSDEKLAINFSRYTIAQIRDLTPAELTSVFGPDSVPETGNLYRLSMPATKKLLHGNTLCGADDTQWMVTSVLGKTLQVAFFSGSSMPVLKPEAIANSTSLCGTFTYTK